METRERLKSLKSNSSEGLDYYMLIVFVEIEIQRIELRLTFVLSAF